MSLINNIIFSFSNLRSDFTGLTINTNLIFQIISNTFLAFFVILVLYLLGSKINLKKFISEEDPISFFVKTSLGYILVCSGIFVLGFFGLFYKDILYLYYLLIVIVSFYPAPTVTRNLKGLFSLLKTAFSNLKEEKLLFFLILGFVCLSFLRLIPPETGVDAIWYHTEYPNLYLNQHSMMSVDPRGVYYAAVTPTLSDMLYVFTESVGSIDSSRFIHFGFYLLVVLFFLTAFRKRFKPSLFAALLFVTSPIVIRVSSSAYAEFSWMLCWISAVYLITEKNRHRLKDIILPAILFGGALATKLWLIPFFGVFVIFLTLTNLRANKFHLLKLLFLFSFICLLVPFLWYLRAYMITGNPLFPTFWNYPDGSPNNPFSLTSILSTFNLQGLRVRVLSSVNVSPLSILAVIFILPLFLININFSFLKKPFVLFFIILTAMQFTINYSIHRFVMPFYTVSSVILSFGLFNFFKINKLTKYFLAFFAFALFLYYFINTLLILPYGLGLADANKYISRTLSRDNSSYYDYGHLFSSKIKNGELVSAYGIWGFYYANFKRTRAEEVFWKKDRSLSALISNGSNKLLITGGDMLWLCKTESLSDCRTTKYKLLAFYKYKESASGLYLYEIENNK